MNLNVISIDSHSFVQSFFTVEFLNSNDVCVQPIETWRHLTLTGRCNAGLDKTLYKRAFWDIFLMQISYQSIPIHSTKFNINTRRTVNRFVNTVHVCIEYIRDPIALLSLESSFTYYMFIQQVIYFSVVACYFHFITRTFVCILKKCSQRILLLFRLVYAKHLAVNCMCYFSS